MVKVTGTIKIEIGEKVFELTRQEAKELYSALEQEFGSSKLTYPSGVRYPSWQPAPGQFQEFKYPNEITC